MTILVSRFGHRPASHLLKRLKVIPVFRASEIPKRLLKVLELLFGTFLVAHELFLAKSRSSFLVIDLHIDRLALFFGRLRQLLFGLRFTERAAPAARLCLALAAGIFLPPLLNVPSNCRMTLSLTLFLILWLDFVSLFSGMCWHRFLLLVLALLFLSQPSLILLGLTSNLI